MMTDWYWLYSIVALPGVSPEQFESVLRGQVVPAVRSGSTRGGEVSSEGLYRTVLGQYRWVVRVRDAGSPNDPPGFVQTHEQRALEELAAVGVVYSREVLSLVDSSPPQPFEQRVVRPGSGTGDAGGPG